MSCAKHHHGVSEDSSQHERQENNHEQVKEESGNCANCDHVSLVKLDGHINNQFHDAVEGGLANKKEGCVPVHLLLTDHIDLVVHFFKLCDFVVFV